MEAAIWNMRPCSILLKRCDMLRRGDAARAGRGVPAMPDEAASAAPYTTGRIQENNGVASAVIKTERDDEGTITSQGPVLWESTVTDVDLSVKEENDCNVKTEDAMSEVPVKQELDIESTVLQAQSVPRPPSLLSQVCVDVRPGASTASFDPVFAETAPGIKLEDDYYKEDTGVPFDTNVLLNVKKINIVYDGVLREQARDPFDEEDRSMDIQKGGQCSCVKEQTRCDYMKDVSGVEAETSTIEKLYKCEYCKYRTTEKSDLIEHTPVRTKKKRYKCVQCEYSTSHPSFLKRHICTHTGEKPYKCKQCEYRASQFRSLKMHMYTHSGMKPFKCEWCEYRAFQLSDLKRHARTHTGRKPYKCGQCEYSTSRLDCLKVHLYTHTNEKPYKCEQCEYSASRLIFLKVHMCTHTGEKPYKCEQCEYSSLQMSNLKRHMLTHTGEKSFKCEQCEYSTCTRSNLKRHIGTHRPKTGKM